jgi:putative peptidoglycan lipid II flippase
MQDTKTPVKIAMGAMLSNLLLSLTLMGPMKHSGLALANALASGINFVLLFYFLRKKLRRIDARKIIRSFLKIAAASAIMGISGWAVLHGGLWKESGRNAEKIFSVGGTVALCIGIYITVSYLLKSDEMDYLFKMIRERTHRRGA